MIKKIFSSQTNSIVGAAVIIGLASFVSRLIGILRDRILVHLFGAGNVLDSYYAAFRIPDFIYNLLIVGALSAGFIPVFIKVFTQDKEYGWKITNSIINILIFVMLPVCGLLFIFTPQLTHLLVPGFSPEKMQTTSMLTRIMFLSPILLGLSGIVGGVLQATKNFLIYSLTPIMYNIGIIVGATVLYPIFGIKGLAYGVVLGALMHLVIQLPSLLRQGFHYRPQMMWKDKNVREIGKMMIPRTLGLASNQLNLLIITILSSTLTSGSIAIFNLANNLQYFPIGIIGISFAVAAFPTLTELFALGKKEEMTHNISLTVRQIIFLIMPITIILLILRAQIVRVVLGTGQFDWQATIATADALAFFSLSLFAQCLIPLLARAFYAIHNTWLPFAIGIASDVANVALGIYFKDILGVSGLAISFSVSMIIQVCLLWIMLRKKLGTLHEGKILYALFKISIATMLMAIIIQSLKYPLASLVDMTKFWGIFTQGLVAGITGLLIYGLTLYLLKLEEMMQLKDGLKRRWLKLWNVQGEILEE